MLAKSRARAARIRLCSHTHHISPATSHFAALADPQPAATSSCTFMPMPRARYLAQQHALLQFPQPAHTCRPEQPVTAAPARCEATCGNGTVGMQGPDTHTGVVQKWDAAPRTCLQMQAVNAGRPSNAAGARAGSGTPRHRACDARTNSPITLGIP